MLRILNDTQFIENIDKNKIKKLNKTKKPISSLHDFHKK